MPFGDGTGPAGLGPMTGRAAGYCAGYGMPGYMNPIGGRGFWGRGRGGGRGRRNWFWATGLPGWARSGWGYGAYVPPEPMTDQDELDMLKTQAEQLQQNLQQINQRIDELHSQKQE